MIRTVRAIIAGTAVSGTLDIISAFAFSAMGGVTAGQVLRYVASGPFGDAMRKGGAAEALAGLGVHYALMAIMVVVFTFAALRIPAILRRPLLSGMIYGLIIYGVMYWIVTPARFGVFPKLTLWGVGNALFSHLICVGLSMGFVVSRVLRR